MGKTRRRQPREAVEASMRARQERKRTAEARRATSGSEVRLAIGPAFETEEGARRFARDLDFWSAMGGRAEAVRTSLKAAPTSWEVELVFREDDAEARKRAERIELALLQDPRR